MHEMSIAEAIWDLARRHVPENAVLRTVRMRAGPMRGIDPQCMLWAWQALTSERAEGSIALEIDSLPWQLHCPACGAKWQAPELTQQCSCGSDQVRPVGGDELQLVSIEVDDIESASEKGVHHASSGRAECAETQR